MIKNLIKALLVFVMTMLVLNMTIYGSYEIFGMVIGRNDFGLIMTLNIVLSFFLSAVFLMELEK